MVEVGVAVDERLGARDPAAVDQAGVVQLVREDDLAPAGQRADVAEIAKVARAEQKRGLVPGERGEALLEPLVKRHVPRDQPRRARAGAEALRGVGGRLAD